MENNGKDLTIVTVSYSYDSEVEAFVFNNYKEYWWRSYCMWGRICSSWNYLSIRYRCADSDMVSSKNDR